MIDNDRSPRAILTFWLPLSAQWVMMAVEGPFVAAIIARLADPTFNLAAYGVTFAFAILAEAPIIMLMSASTALVVDGDSYCKLRNFANALNALATGLILLVLLSPLYGLVMSAVLDLPPRVAELTRGALWFLLPWPAAIGYRRFLHGVLIRSGRTRLVMYGTTLRLVTMAGVGLLLAGTALPGAWVGAGALSAGVVVEAVAARVMAAGAIRELLQGRKLPGAPEVGDEPESIHEAGVSGEQVVVLGQLSVQREPPRIELGYAAIWRFYYPLALTSFIGLGVQPLLTFFMGRAPSPVASLAVFPVVDGLTFLFRALGLSFQEAAIALLGDRCEYARQLAAFASRLSLVSTAGLALVVFTPLASLWFETVSGLAPGLSAFAFTPARIAVALPALTVALSLQRGILVQGRRTNPITVGTAVEVGGIALLFPLFAWGLGMNGATAAMLAFVGGRLASVLSLMPSILGVVGGAGGRQA